MPKRVFGDDGLKRLSEFKLNRRQAVGGALGGAAAAAAFSVPMIGGRSYLGQRASAQDASTIAIANNGASDLKNFNMALVYDSASWFMSTSIFSRLIVMDYGPEFALHPQLAKEWTASDDARVYTFHLVDNATWHDGQPVTAADVKMTYEGIVEQQGAAASFLSGIQSIETPDDYTVIMTLTEPDASFLYSIAVYPRTPILPAHLYGGKAWKDHPNNLQPIGSGPFKLEEFRPGERVILAANPDYFGGPPKLSRVISRFIPDNRTALAAFQAGEYAALDKPPALFLIKQIQDSPGLAVDAPAGPWAFYIGFNMTKAPFDNVEVRQAFATAIDRQDVTDKVTRGVAPASEGPYTKGITWAWNPDVKSPAYDTAKAESMLDAAGFPRDGETRMKIKLAAISDETYPLVAEVIKEQLGKIGVDAEIELFDNPTFHEAMPKMEHDLLVYALWIGPDPNEWQQQLRTGGFRNWFGYSNPEVESLFDQGKLVVDQEQRKQAYFKIQEIVNRDMPRINLFDAPYSFAHSTSYNGFFSQDGFISYRMDLTQVSGA